MEQNEVTFPETEIMIQPGTVVFQSYEAIKEQAELLAEKIKTVEVTEENVKDSKKLLAAVNRKVKELEDGRISVKKMLLESYVKFEEQVKEIVTIVKDADTVVRQQVKHLEETERAEKHAILEERFLKRIVHYTFRDLFHFRDFIKPKHLNKTVSVDAVEKEMVEFLEKITRDFNAIGKMQDAEAILTHYVEVKDLAEAITLHEASKARKQAVVDSQAIKEPVNKTAYLVSIRCENDMEVTILQRMLEGTGFHCTVDKIY